LSPKDAAATGSQVAKAVAAWRYVAKKSGIRAAEIDRMASAFEHEDLQKARQRVSAQSVAT